MKEKNKKVSITEKLENRLKEAKISKHNRETIIDILYILGYGFVFLILVFLSTTIIVLNLSFFPKTEAFSTIIEMIKRIQGIILLWICFLGAGEILFITGLELTIFKKKREIKNKI